MTEPQDTVPKQDTAPKRGFPWVKLLLFTSLAVNLLIVGMVAGAFMRPHGDMANMQEPGAIRMDLGLGPYGKALATEDRQALRRVLGEREAETAALRRGLRAEMLEVLEILRAPQFDGSKLKLILDRQQARLVAPQNAGKALLLDHLEQMTVQERRGYARRLERSLGRLIH